MPYDSEARRTPHQDLIQRIRDCLRFCETNEAPQRQREADDLRFAALDHWPDEIKQLRAGQPAQSTGTGTLGMPPTPARPCLVVDMLGPMIRQVTNQQRNARMAVEVAPKSEGASQEIADLYQGLIRQIEYGSHAATARNQAFERAVKCGRGYYRVLLGYANDGDFDLDLQIEPILNQANVFLDPTHELPDGSDARWAIVLSSMTRQEFEDEYPGSDLAGRAVDSWSELADLTDNWVSGEGPNQKVRVAEYFYVTPRSRTLRLMTNGTEERPFVDERPPGWSPVLDKDQKPIERDLADQTVEWVKTNGLEILERKPWLGKYIPIIQVVGDVLVLPGESDSRRYQGIVRPARDPQLGLDVMASTEVENIGLTPKSPFIGYVESLEGYESWWNLYPVRNFPMLPIKAAYDRNGNALPPPRRDSVEPPIQAIAHAQNMFRESVRSATGIFEASLGQASPKERSGKAILALQRQSDASTSNYLDNLAQSIVYEGKIVVDLIPKVYDRPGRIVRMITGMNEARPVMINQPFVPGPTGQPQAVPAGTPGATLYSFPPNAEYAVVCRVGKGFDTAREEMASVLGDLLGNNPQLLSIFGDIFFENQDFAGSTVLADRAKFLLDPRIQQAESESGADAPQKLAQAMQTIQQLTQRVQQMTDAAQAKALEQETKLQIAQMEQQTKLETAKLSLIGQLAGVQAKVDAENARTFVELAETRLSKAVDILNQRLSEQHEAGMQAADAAHEHAMAVSQPEPVANSE